MAIHSFGNPQPSGATSTTGSADIALTSASRKVQRVAMTAVDKSVTLPDATTLEEGQSLFTMVNFGDYTFVARDKDGVMLGAIDPKQVVDFHLPDNSTTAGTWDLEGEHQKEYAWFAKDVVEVVAGTYLQIKRIDDTRELAVWLSTATVIKACMITDDLDGTFTVTSPITVHTASVGCDHVTACVLTTSLALVCYRDASAGDDTHYAQTIGINAASLDAAGADQDLVISDTYYQDGVERINDTQALLCMYSAANQFIAYLLDISGATVTNTDDTGLYAPGAGTYGVGGRSIQINAAGDTATTQWNYSANVFKDIIITITATTVASSTNLTGYGYYFPTTIGPMHDDHVITMAPNGYSNSVISWTSYYHRDLGIAISYDTGDQQHGVLYNTGHNIGAKSPNGKNAVVLCSNNFGLVTSTLFQSFYYDTKLIPSTGSAYPRDTNTERYGAETYLAFFTNNRGVILFQDPANSSYVSVSLFEVAK